MSLRKFFPFRKEECQPNVRTGHDDGNTNSLNFNFNDDEGFVSVVVIEEKKPLSPSTPLKNDDLSDIIPPEQTKPPLPPVLLKNVEPLITSSHQTIALSLEEKKPLLSDENTAKITPASEEEKERLPEHSSLSREIPNEDSASLLSFNPASQKIISPRQEPSFFKKIFCRCCKSKEDLHKKNDDVENQNNKGLYSIVL
jgi:hypothetical protein